MTTGNIVPVLIGAGAALLLNLLFTPLLLFLSHKYEWYDEVNHRKIHTGRIPRIGGVGIFLSFLIVAIVFIVFPGLLPQGVALASFFRFLPFLVAFLLIHLLGLVDDFSDLRPRIKIIFQAVAALIVTVAGTGFSNLYIPFADITVSLGPFSYVIAFVWVLGMCNAVNLIDGLDGLAGGTTAIAALFMGCAFLILHNYTSALLAFVLAGGIAGFLFFNLPPARLFMGDSGALFIGFVLATLPLMEPAQSGAGTPLVFSITILLLPILDTFAAIIRRIRRRTPIHLPDREHIHHKLLDLGVSNWGILGISYLITAILGTTALIWVMNPAGVTFLWVLGSWVIAVVFFFLLDALNRRRKQTSSQES